VRSLWRSPAKHVDLLPQDQVFRSSVALALKREARIPTISLNRSVIRMRAYAARLLLTNLVDLELRDRDQEFGRTWWGGT
jgi:hypothetical protein